MREIDARQWPAISGGRSYATGAAADATRTPRRATGRPDRADPQLAGVAADPAGFGRTAGPAAGELPVVSGPATHAHGSAGIPAERSLEMRRRSGMLLIELPRQDTLDFD